jgi:hypothetical protein
MRSLAFRSVFRLAFGGVLVSLCVLAPVDAAAAPPTTQVTEGARTGLGVDLGIASAVGLGGVTLTRQLASHVRLEAGVGLGVTGIQLSLMPEVVFGGEGN